MTNLRKPIYQITKRFDNRFGVWRRWLNSTWELVRVFDDKTDAHRWVYGAKQCS